MKERSLHTLLDGFQKRELQDLGHILGSDSSPRLRKDQLVSELEGYLYSQPGKWMSHLMERDVRLLRDLVHAGPGKVHYLDYADYPSLLEASGLVEFDDSDENWHKVWISRELYDIVAPEVDKVMSSCEKSGRYELERIALGYLNLYGVIPTEKFIDLMMDWYESVHGSDFEPLSAMLRQSALVKMYRYEDSLGDYICSPCVENPEEIFEWRERSGMKRFRNFSYEAVMEAGKGAPYFTVGMKTPEGMRLEAMYKRMGLDGFDLIKAEHDTWMEAQYTCDVNDALFQPLQDSPRGSSVDEQSWKACCQIVGDYANSVPKWMLCGYSSSEKDLYKVDFHPESDQVDFSKEDVYKFGIGIPHVPPYAPCPCGSGFAYRNCHGKYLS